ncbi:hypothetical protein Bhyg_05159, partial [Pseudolycoriella hygida]
MLSSSNLLKIIFATKTVTISTQQRNINYDGTKKNAAHQTVTQYSQAVANGTLVQTKDGKKKK